MSGEDDAMDDWAAAMAETNTRPSGDAASGMSDVEQQNLMNSPIPAV